MPLKVYVAFYPVLFGGHTLFALYSAMASMSLSKSPSANALAISVTYRDNGIEIVNIGIIVLAIGGSCFHFGNNYFFDRYHRLRPGSRSIKVSRTIWKARSGSNLSASGRSSSSVSPRNSGSCIFNSIFCMNCL